MPCGNTINKLSLDDLQYVKKLQQKNKQLQQENKKLNGAIQTYDILLKANTEENARLKEIENKLNFIKNRKNQGASQENINKMAIEFVNSYLKEVE